jgi:hypothetical protein
MSHSSPLEPSDALPIPEGAVVLAEMFLDNPASSDEREARRLAIAALRQAMAERQLKLPLGPEIDPEDPDRLLALNRFAVQLTTTGFYSDEVAVAADPWLKSATAPQLLLAAAVDVEQGVVHFPGVLTAGEVASEMGPSQAKGDRFVLPLKAFRGGIERLFTLVRLLDPQVIPRRALAPDSTHSPAVRVLDWMQGLVGEPLQGLGAVLMPITSGAFRQAGASREATGGRTLAQLSIPLGLSADGELLTGEDAATCIERFQVLLIPCGSSGVEEDPNAEHLILRLVGELAGDLLPDGLELLVKQGSRQQSIRSASSTMLELQAPADEAIVEVTLTPPGGQFIVLPPLLLSKA